MTVDKIVAKSDASCLTNNKANIQNFTKLNQNCFISNFDAFMLNGNPIV